MLINDINTIFYLNQLLFRYGRVNYVLAKRLQLLNEVQRLQDLMDVKGDMSYTCETAMHFFWSHVLPRWNKYLTTLKNLEENSDGVSSINSLSSTYQIFIFKFVGDFN